MNNIVTDDALGFILGWCGFGQNPLNHKYTQNTYNVTNFPTIVNSWQIKLINLMSGDGGITSRGFEPNPRY